MCTIGLHVHVHVHVQYISTTMHMARMGFFWPCMILSEIHSLNSRKLCCALLFVRTRMNLLAHSISPLNAWSHGSTSFQWGRLKSASEFIAMFSAWIRVPDHWVLRCRSLQNKSENKLLTFCTSGAGASTMNFVYTMSEFYQLHLISPVQIICSIKWRIFPQFPLVLLKADNWRQLTTTDDNWRQLTTTDDNWRQLTTTDDNWWQHVLIVLKTKK